MTEYPDSTIKSCFDAAWLNLEAAQAAATAVQGLRFCHARQRIMAMLGEAADLFFDTPSPTLGAVAEKLQIQWGDELFTDDGDADHKRIVVGDIRRLERIHAGVEEPEASGGMDLVRIASEWTSALQEYTSQEAAPDVQAKLLSKRAPDLNAVIKKLELLGSGPRQPSILRDLRSFATAEPQSAN